MADIGINQNWLVSPTKEVEDMWMQQQVQEKKSQIAATKRSIMECEQKIEDLEKGVMLNLKAKLIMLEKEVGFLEHKRAQMGKDIIVEASK